MPIVVDTPNGLNSGACSPWVTLDDLSAPFNDSAQIDQTVMAECLQAASDILFMLSGRQYPGVCSDTVRPCARSLDGDHGRPVGGGWWPGDFGGSYSVWGWCGCNRTERSGCNSIPEITLGAYPLVAISEVKVDGVALDPARYRIDDDRWLVRLPNADGSTEGFPCCQDMTLPDTAVGTWSVAFTYGRMPPPAGVLAAKEFGCQLALSTNPTLSSQCRLPQRVTQITRQGITAVVLDSFNQLDKKRLGLFACDAFLTAVNPAGIARRSTVTSPDLRRRVRRTG